MPDMQQSLDGTGSLLSSLRQRLEAKRALFNTQPANSSAPDGGQQPVDGENADLEQPGAADATSMIHEQLLHDDHLQLVDLVSFDRCRELIQVPPVVEQQLFHQFATDWLARPLPAPARQQADELHQLPQETLGLYVAPHPRISNGSLYKMEQRLAGARKLDVQRIVKQLQEQFPDAQQIVGTAAPIGPGSAWLDEHGLMLYEPDPSKANKQRPWRRYDQNADVTGISWLPAVLAPLHLLDSRGVSYRLDVELGKLEFEVHPYMTLEHQLAAKLLCSFREYHRRVSLGLVTFYSNKLAALEDGLLNAREQLFSVQEQGQEVEQAMAATTAVAQAEREVAEVRQLREEEEAHLLAAVDAMSHLWKQLCDVRDQQGGTRLTDLGFSVVQLPREDSTPTQADGLTRQQLDIALLVAEAEAIAGLPPYPSAFPLNQADAELTGFALRRVESTASSHALLRSQLQERLALLQDRVSADPDDPEIKSLQQQLRELGPAPWRLPMSHQEEMELWNRAEEEVAAGRVGVYRPPRLQPCLIVLPATASGLRAAARLGSSPAVSAAGTNSPHTAATIRSRLGWSAAGIQTPQQQQTGQASSSEAGAAPPPAAAAASGGDGVVGLGTGQLLPVSQQGPRLPVKLSYYVRLLVNGRVVGTSESVALKDDFTMDFRDVFSIRLLKWPDSMQLELWETGTFRDTLVAAFYLIIPGLAGTPHVDPQPKPYSWTSPNPVPHQKLLQALAALQPLGLLPAADVANWQTAMAATPSAAGMWQSRPAGPSTGQTDHAGTVDAAGSSSGANTTDSSSRVDKLKNCSVAAVYPSGRLFVRCGWVPDSGMEPHATPFSSSIGATTGGTSSPMLQTLRLPPPSSAGLGAASDGMVQVSLQGSRTATASGSPTAKALSGPGSSPHASPYKAGVRGLGPREMIGNPLAHIGEDVEVGARLAPPVPHVKADRSLHRAAIGGSKSRSRTASKWLAQHLLDPNDPRNAVLLELLRAREAAAHSGSTAAAVGASDLFRLDISNEISMAVDRAADRRAAFIKQRWLAGPFRSAGVAVGLGARPLGTVAPLSAKDTLELQDAYREALALVEAASMGLGAAGRQSAVALAAAMSGRQERSLRWAQGALAKAIEAREAAIRAFALRVRASCNQLGSGRALGRKFKTDDVVKDAPLPEFKLDLSSLAAALAPVRPLRPQRRAVKKLQAHVPRDTRLVITLQRASNLPRRLAVGGGVRQQSPNRSSGVRMSNTSRFNRDRGASSRDNISGFRSPTRATRDMPAGDWAAQQDEQIESEGFASGGESLSCFVEVKFRGKAQRTAAVDSNMPMWNEQLLFPVVGLDQEASPTALKESDGLITINIFDEVITPTAAAKAARHATRAGQTGGMEALSEGPALPERERRFLGCLRIPLAAVYQAEVMFGAFKLDVPPVLLGYVQDTGRPPSLSVYLTLKPRLAAPTEADEERVSGEQGEVARHARKWVAGISSLPQCRSRVIKAMAVDPEGVGTLVTRFLAPTALPPGLAEQAAQVQSSGAEDARDRLLLAAARWVAHVPFLDDASLGKKRSNVWASNADFVAMSAGDHEEHAHLLAGCFLELGQEAFVVLGASTVGAHAAFVLTTGRPLRTAEALGSTASPHEPAAQQVSSAGEGAAATGAAESSSAADASAAEAGDSSAVADGGISGRQHTQQLLRQRLQQATAVAQARQQQAAAAAQAAAVNPAAAMAAAAAMTQRQFDVSQLQMWNPLSGQCVPVRDPACEMREVGVLYNRDNIWANIQLSGHPWDVSWNLADHGCWRPFFGAVLPPRELASIQVAPTYQDLDNRCYEELEARVEETVRDALYEARSVVVTKPNNKLSRVLKALLKEVPAHMNAINSASLAASMAMSDTTAALVGQAAADVARERLQQRLQLIQSLQVSHNDRVAREMRGCLINGHIIALPFSDTYADAVAEVVINTGLHRTVDPRVKFAMAAYVEPLGAAWVCCLWIYVAAIRETS